MRSFLLRVLLLVGFLPAFGCGDLHHLFPPTPPRNLQAEFTEDIFGTDGVRLTWKDPNTSNDIGFAIYRDGGKLDYLDPFCRDISGDLECSPAYPAYFDTDVSRGETHCYSVSSYYYDWFDDAIFGESDRCPEVCITIPLQGFTGSWKPREDTQRSSGGGFPRALRGVFPRYRHPV